MNDINIMPLIMAFVIMAVILGGITIVTYTLLTELKVRQLEMVNTERHGGPQRLKLGVLMNTSFIHLRNGEKRHKGVYNRQQAMESLCHKVYL